MIDWHSIDTVLLDMDGTLLDLHYDVQFWSHLLPQRFAAHHGLAAAEADTRLAALFEAKRHQLQFYCTDWWAEVTQLDISALKLELAHLIRYRRDAEAFLAGLRSARRRSLIVTNAHRDVFDLKHRHTDIAAHVDVVESAHDHGLPKEAPALWTLIIERHGLDPARTLLLDDNLHALHAAGASGIRHLVAVNRPDTLGPELDTQPFPGIDEFAALGALPDSDVDEREGAEDRP